MLPYGNEVARGTGEYDIPYLELLHFIRVLDVCDDFLE